MEGYCSTGQSPQRAVVPVEEEEEEESYCCKNKKLQYIGVVNSVVWLNILLGPSCCMSVARCNRHKLTGSDS
jgi:hypothetical protein